MADYNMGTARGRIMIEYDNNGVRRFGQDMDQTQNRTRSASDVFKGAAGAMGKAGLGIAGGFALAIHSAANFEKSLSDIKAVTGSSSADMEKMRQKALQLGADTKFSASEAADAMGELAKAGVSVPDILNGAADAATALAAAGGVDLATAAELSANAMNQFALKAADLPRVADLIAGAANASAIDVGDFGQSLKQVGAVAHLAGIDFKDTSVAIALMGNAGIKGSDAGTSLKTMLSNLVPHSAKARDEMKELGLMTKKGANAFFDAHGKAKSLAEISQLLQNALKGQTKEQKLATLNTLFGSDAIRAAAILTDQGAKGFNNMAGAMTKVKAADVAKTRMDNLSGSIEQLKGSLDTMFIKMGEGGQGPLRSLVDGLTKAVNWFNGLSNGTRQTITTLVLATGAFLLLGSAVIKTVFFFQRLAEAVRVIAALRGVQTVLLNLRGILFVVNGALKNFVASMGRAAVAGARAAAAGIKNAAVAMGRLAVQAGRAAIQLGAQAARAAGQAALALGRMALNAARAAVQLALVAARAIAVGAANFASSVAAGAAALGTMALNAIRTGAAMALALARTVAYAAATAAIRVATLAWAAAQWLLDAALNANPIGLIIIAIAALIAIIVVIATKTHFFQNLWNTVWNGIKTAFAATVNFIKAHWQLIVAILGGPLVAAVILVIKYWDQIKHFISNAVNFIINFVRSHWRLIASILGGPLVAAVILVIKYWSQIKSFISNVTSAIVNYVKSRFTQMKNAVTSIGSIVGVIAGIFNRFNSAVRSRITSILGTIRGLPGRIRSVFNGAGNWLYGIGRAIIQGLINGVQSMINKFTGLLHHLTSLIPKVKGPLSKDKKLLTPAGQKIMEGLIKGIAQNIPPLKKLLSNVTTTIVNSPIQHADAGHLEWHAIPTQVQNQSLIDWDKLSRTLAAELKKHGVGAAYLDGKMISNAIGKIQAQATSAQRRTR